MGNEQEQNEPTPVSLSDRKPTFCSWIRSLDGADLDGLIREFEIDID